MRVINSNIAQYRRHLGHTTHDNATLPVKLLHNYLTSNQKTAANPLSSTEAASLGQLLCGLSSAQWAALVTNSSLATLATAYLAPLQCALAADTAAHLAARLTSEQMYGEPGSWSPAQVLSLGWLLSTLSPSQLASLPPHR